MFNSIRELSLSADIFVGVLLSDKFILDLLRDKLLSLAKVVIFFSLKKSFFLLGFMSFDI